MIDQPAQTKILPDAVTLIPRCVLERQPAKVLFITHLAIGDFTYLQNCFRALAAARPNLHIHLWVDELRRTDDPAQWSALKNYSLYDWLAACAFFEKIYRETYNPALYEKSITDARAENYDAVIYLTTLRSRTYGYAKLARAIAPAGFVVGIKSPFRFFKPHLSLAYRNLDTSLPLPKKSKKHTAHISGVYAGWFQKLFGIYISPEARMPRIDIPLMWMESTKEMLVRWGIDKSQPAQLRKNKPVVFINITSKSPERSWTMAHAAALIHAMQQTEAWGAAHFVLNAMPADLAGMQKQIESLGLAASAHSFSATENFFQLPAMLARCDLIVSVETATMHLANAVGVPVIALMRMQNPEWMPLDFRNSVVLMTSKRHERVCDLTETQVMHALQNPPWNKA